MGKNQSKNYPTTIFLFQSRKFQSQHRHNQSSSLSWWSLCMCWFTWWFDCCMEYRNSSMWKRSQTETFVRKRRDSHHRKFIAFLERWSLLLHGNPMENSLHLVKNIVEWFSGVIDHEKLLLSFLLLVFVSDNLIRFLLCTYDWMKIQ